jgi:23S rRNA (cytidine1920-2'-O)/16S rRNA (cytidine1409-2'-O)-methyltransferase
VTARRLDAELVTRGLARSRAQAGELIRGGAVMVEDQVVAKASQPVSTDAAITLTREPSPWVGRAALKLLRALDLWPIEVAGRRCLDVGASTGGFTQVLLERDAAHVTALDVGHGQLAASVASDPRVLDLPETNIRQVDAGALGGPFDLVVCDLSFISLTLALPPIRPLLAAGGDLVVLVKPQFEVGRERLSRTGVVASRHEHRRVLRHVHATATDLGLDVRAAAPSPIAGAEGNREFLLWLMPRRPGTVGLEVDAMLDAIDREEEEQ